MAGIKDFAALQALRDQLKREQEARAAAEAKRREADALAQREANLFRHSIGTVAPLRSIDKALHRPPEPEPIARQHLADEQAALAQSLSDEFSIESLLETLESNYLGWSSNMAPAIMGAPDQPELGVELTNSFCRTDPEIAKQFARVTFLSDNRDDLEGVKLPVLILQCSEDLIAPASVGAYVHERLEASDLVTLKATGHCPNLSAPEETVEAIRAWI